MRFTVLLLDTSATVNSFKKRSVIEISQGETVDLYFQLADKNQDYLRYCPATGATLFVEIARFPEYFPTNMNQRDEQDYSIRRYATQPFAQDGSIWKLPLSTTDTANIMSSNIRFTLVEGSTTRVALVKQAITTTRSEG